MNELVYLSPNTREPFTTSDYLTADEIAAVGQAENKIGVLLSLKHDYRQIKEELLTR